MPTAPEISYPPFGGAKDLRLPARAAQSKTIAMRLRDFLALFAVCVVWGINFVVAKFSVTGAPGWVDGFEPFPYDPELQRHSNVLKAAVRLAHDQVLSAIRRDGNLYGMGTTVVGCMLRGTTAAVAHVGDSRAYRLHDGKLDRLTEDHTWVNEQVVAGFLSEEQARDHPLKNVVTRALGGDSEVRVDLQEIELAPGDTLLLCSDGLTTMLDDPEIEAQLRASANGDLAATCDRLVTEANQRGGHDNVTVVLLRAESPDDE